MNDPDVSGWRPRWVSAQEQVTAARDDLLSLPGHRVVAAWGVWNLELGQWFADLPVVMEFDHGRRLEICWQKFDDLSITWNTIDVSVAPVAWVTWPLIWRADAHPALTAMVDELVTTVAVTEHLFTTRVVNPVPQDGGSGEALVWLTSGLWLGTEMTGLHVFNALDENGLSNEPPQVGDDLRMKAL
jgi:hypothetical protein